MLRRPPPPPLFPYTTLFRSLARPLAEARDAGLAERSTRDALTVITAAYEYFGNFRLRTLRSVRSLKFPKRSEEHTSELQSRLHLVCRLLLEKKKKHKNTDST